MTIADSKSPVKKRFTWTSVTLLVLHLLSMYLCLFISGETFKKTIMALAFVLCFDFLYLFFVETFCKEYIQKNYGPVLIVMAPVFSLISVNFREPVIAAVVCLLFLCLTAGIFSFYLSAVQLIGVTAYSALFMDNKFSTLLPFLLFMLLSCIITELIKSKQSIVQVIIIQTLMFFIVAVVTSGFVLTKVFSIANLVVCGCGIMIILLVYYVRKYLNLPDYDSSIFSSLNSVLPSSSHNNQNAIATQEDYEALMSSFISLKKHCSEVESSFDELAEAFSSSMEQKESTEAVAAENMTVQGLSAQDMAVQGVNDTAVSEDIPGNNSVSNESLNSLPLGMEYSISAICAADFPFIKELRESAPKLYSHCQNIAELSAQAADIINCDAQLAYAIGFYHEYYKPLGNDGEVILINELHVPSFLLTIINRMKNKKNNQPVPREAGIVALTDDIIHTEDYILRTKKNNLVNTNQIINNTLKVRNDQNFLRMCGFTNEEVQLLKLFFSEQFSENHK